MDELDKALASAPFGSDLAYQAVRRAHPDWVYVGSSEGLRAMAAKGWRVRAIFRNPFWPDVVMPSVFYGPPTDQERQARSIGSALAQMVSGQDLKRAGLRRR
jgi:hypothetical protein